MCGSIAVISIDGGGCQGSGELGYEMPVKNIYQTLIKKRWLKIAFERVMVMFAHMGTINSSEICVEGPCL